MIGIEVLTIGGEIVSGDTPDTNFLFFARGLAELGLVCRWHTAVPDDRETLTEALQIALGRARVILMTGGLGPTPDDITRKVLAAVLKRQLILREDLVEQIRDQYARIGRKPPSDLQSQALIPFGTELIENTVGTAPGMRMQTGDGRLIYALPGVPHEMERMAEQIVLPEISSLIKGPRMRERRVRTVGIPESALEGLVTEMVPPGVSVAFLPHLGMVDVCFSIDGEPDDADPILDRLVSDAKSKIGEPVYAEGKEEIEEAVGRVLLDRGWQIAVAESLTGGSLGARIVRVPGASAYYLGGVVAYDNGAKNRLLGVPGSWIVEHGAVSAPVAEAMAHGVRERFEADVGVSATGIAGPDGGTDEKPVGLVYFGIAWPGGRVAVRRWLIGGREQVIERSVNVALDLVRRVASGIPVTPEV